MDLYVLLIIACKYYLLIIDYIRLKDVAMELNPINKKSIEMISKSFSALERHLGTDLLTIYGGFVDGMENLIKEIIEDLNKDVKKNDKLTIVLTTGGGSLTPVQKMVQIFRHFYKEVNFIVPDYAYSAGTILCMSGDNIYMSYFSNLGPIDPQVSTKDGKFVSALGYLDKISEMIEKAKNKTLTDAEFIILRDFDLAELRYYETAKELAVDLLKDWLATYKFKNWNTHSDGSAVTFEEKQKRAEEIANNLSDNSRWKSHGRPIPMDVLEKELNIRINNISNDLKLSKLVDDYYKTMREYIALNKFGRFYQTRKFL